MPLVTSRRLIEPLSWTSNLDCTSTSHCVDLAMSRWTLWYGTKVKSPPDFSRALHVHIDVRQEGLLYSPSSSHERYSKLRSRLMEPKILVLRDLDQTHSLDPLRQFLLPLHPPAAFLSGMLPALPPVLPHMAPFHSGMQPTLPLLPVNSRRQDLAHTGNNSQRDQGCQHHRAFIRCL